MCRKGLSALEKILIGSVTSQVLRHAPVPVLVTKKGRKPFAPRRILVPTDFAKGEELEREVAFKLAAGKSRPEDIVKATKRGLLVREVTGYGINPVSGHFSGGAAGFWIENGRIVHPVRGLTIAATAAAMLEGLDMAGNDLDLDRGIAAPTFRVAEMQIGGE